MGEVTVLPRRKFPIETILWSMEFMTVYDPYYISRM